ncbi:hypothetical protein DESC_350009 [Desulfosarcina cetonica]|nr:hypothetical protein DESC_350009 [Desulfosarcina cetonica]
MGHPPDSTPVNPFVRRPGLLWRIGQVLLTGIAGFFYEASPPAVVFLPLARYMRTHAFSTVTIPSVIA